MTQDSFEKSIRNQFFRVIHRLELTRLLMSRQAAQTKSFFPLDKASAEAQDSTACLPNDSQTPFYTFIPKVDCLILSDGFYSV